MIVNLQKILPRPSTRSLHRDFRAILILIIVTVNDGMAENRTYNDILYHHFFRESPFRINAIPITGTITDQNGVSMPGATIVIKGTTQGTTSDIDGNFSLEVPDSSAVLIISYAGYIEQEVTVGNKRTLIVSLQEDVQVTEDIVVVGYGEQRKTSVTGAISSVAAKEIAAVPVANISSALQGRAAGVIVTSNGAPGQAPIVRIRGNGSIGLSADPLYVIDGFPVTDPNFLNSFDNKDIENIEVLKDAAASAIYGSRASNGVVLITTKKGNSKDKKLHVNLDTYAGSQSIWRKLDLLNTSQYVCNRFGGKCRKTFASPPGLIQFQPTHL
jgi:TonB-dependent SusC/RagA subfamily outer membrane receptor